MSKKTTVEITNITPQMALEWLEHVAPNNRKVKGRRVQLYANDMRANRWHLGDQAITFNEDGELVNGQHRLHAIVASGCTVPMMVMRHAPNESMMVIDSGLKRSTDDNFAISGRDYPRNCGATVRQLLYGCKKRRLSITDQEVDEFMENNGEAISFAHECLYQGKMSKSVMRAVVARAWLKGSKRTRIREFCAVLMTGQSNGEEDQAAIRLRNWIYEMHSGTTRGHFKDLYGKTERALIAFMDGKKIDRLDPMKDEAFPIKSIDGGVEEEQMAIAV